MILRDIPYGTKCQQIGDLYLPAKASIFPPILLIHGGGWNSLSKESLEPIARIFCEEDHCVFCINYRLLDDAAWPACLEDCLTAADAILAGTLGAPGNQKCESVHIVGASAGGHLAMIAAAKMGWPRVDAVLSLAGPVDVDGRYPSNDAFLFTDAFSKQFFGTDCVTEVERASANLPKNIRGRLPRLECFHSMNDELVLPVHSQEAVDAWRKAGGEAVLTLFDGPGSLHGLWDSEDLHARQVVPVVESFLRDYARRAR